MVKIYQNGKEFPNFRTDNGWLTLKEAAVYTRLSASTLRRKIDSGELRCSRAAGKLLMKKSWLDAWLEGGEK